MGLGQRACGDRSLAALLLGGCFLARSKSGRSQVLEASLLRIPPFAMANGATLLMASGFFAYTLGNVLFLTNVWHYSILGPAWR